MIVCISSRQHAITYSVVASTSGTFFFNINANTGEISVNGDLTQTGVSVFEVSSCRTYKDHVIVNIFSRISVSVPSAYNMNKLRKAKK